MMLIPGGVANRIDTDFKEGFIYAQILDNIV